MTRPLLTLGLLASTLLLSCCGVPLPSYREDLSKDEVLESLRSRQAQVATLSAEGRGSLSGAKGGNGSFLWRCWVQGTARMRLTLTHRIKGCLADAVIEGDQAQCYDPEAGTLTKGPLRDLAVPGLRQTACLIRLLAGPADGLTWGEGNRVLLDLGAGRSWSLGVNRRYLVWEEAELREADGVLARAAFPLKSYKSAGSVPWPMEMTVDQPGEPWRLKLKFSDVRLGAAIDAGVFELKVPEGTQVVEAP